MGAVISHLVRSWAQAFVAQLAKSDYLTGMLAMSVMGVARDAAARSWSSLLSWLVRRLWVTIHLEEKEAELLRAWLRERPEVHASSEIAVYSQRGEDRARIYDYEPKIDTTIRVRASCRRGRGRWMWITQGDKKTATVSFCGREKEILEEIFEAGREIQRLKREKYLTVVQVYDYGGDIGLSWLHPQERVGKQPGRPVSSVILPQCLSTGLDQAQAILEDAKEFLASEQWYTQRGIPYRRGYLLHGVPGGGKSSLVMALAHDLQLAIYVLSLSSEKMSDDKLNALLQFGMYDPPTILLLEDVDLLHSAVLDRHGTKDAKTFEEEIPKDEGSTDETSRSNKRKSNQLTLSGLLNALDGPTATSGRLLFMTTNAKDRLDPALVRSGRIDYEIEFKCAVSDQIRRLFLHFYSSDNACTPKRGLSSVDGPLDRKKIDHVESSSLGATSWQQEDVEQLAAQFSEKVAASKVQLTTADIQRHLVRHKSNPRRACEQLQNLFNEFDTGLCTNAGEIDRDAKPSNDPTGADDKKVVISGVDNDSTSTAVDDKRMATSGVEDDSASASSNSQEDGKAIDSEDDVRVNYRRDARTAAHDDTRMAEGTTHYSRSSASFQQLTSVATWCIHRLDV